ncbi:unnamed protein product, partial [Brassica rapa subsp. trilocularis]
KETKGRETPITEEEDRDTNLVAAIDNINPMDSVEEEEEEDKNYGDTSVSDSISLCITRMTISFSYWNKW